MFARGIGIGTRGMALFTTSSRNIIACSVAKSFAQPMSRHLLPIAVADASKIAFSKLHTTRANLSPDTTTTTTTTTTATTTTTTIPSPSAPILDATTKESLSRLRSQLRYYAVVDIVGRPYLITKNDMVIVNRLRDVSIGDVLELNRVRELGSADYLVKGAPYVSEQFYTIKATVIEHTKSKMIQIVKKKRRKGYRRTLTHKQTHTILRISEVEINKLD
ncbi:ribosomal protein L21-like protein [Endogone sp. FLAS-F59071]|nr:ribosomal protein L21-like protein [Endogone sp. FLAS-F59071]|eukprot:RUS22339.1 ribosomal protein L21-like protein [Endogone sp. FLAS-F59071]